ncbi:Bug family tripartite tricarboxylate transporter substrate binding protein [Noviherbaspirillum aerium]|uniref:Bug family tripartite tricarboxylate transporter substrate binding protein n=1 Tax=Noviherbaspirillum aerium TaxID=2588497 RepID=UPI00124C0142|nr:tripartite tricarboxylate transporter substrate binding protein [Noviherbaspirillum aerium]
MKTMFQSVVAGLAVLLAMPSSATQANPGEYPKGPVTLIVSYAAGNAADAIARTISQRLSEKWKQPVVVENRPGAAGNLGAAAVAKAAPDGQTLLFTAVAAIAINPHLYPKVGFNVLKDFEFVNLAIQGPMVCVVAPEVPVRNMTELINYTKRHPGKLNYGSSGSGTMPHLTMEQIRDKHGLNVTHVPYKGAGAIMADLLGGLIQVACEGVSVVMPHIKSGKLRALGVTSEKPLTAFPEIPTLASQLGGFTSGAWRGVMAPRGTPELVVSKISKDINEVLAEKEVRTRFDGLGIEVLGENPAKFEQRVRADYEEYGKIVRRLNLKVE